MLLRKVERKKWLPDCTWVPVGDFKADPLGDLASSKGALSFWHIPNKSDELQVAAAVAAARDKVDEFSYYVVPMELVEKEFALKQTAGQCADRTISKKNHYDVVQLTERSLLKLSQLLRDAGEQKNLIFDEWGKQIADAIAAGTIDKALVKQKVIEGLVKRGMLSA